MKSLAYNRRAKFDYDIVEVFEAGIKLLGTEVKSVRKSNISLKGAFVTIHGGEVYLTNATIPPWQVENAPTNYEPTRPRKLLLSKGEIKELIGAKEAKGLTIIPIKMYSKGAHLKLEIALARGKRKYDKKEDKKRKDLERDIDRVLRGKE